VTNIGGGQAQVSFTTATLAVGTHTIIVAYSGDSNFTSSALTVTQTVSKANALTTITTTTPTNVFGQPTTFVITVTAISPGAGTPTGTVSVTAAGSPLTLSLSGGTANFTTSSLPVGSDAILATYNRDNDFNGGSNASFTETINQAIPTVALTSSQPDSAVGQLVTFTATVSAVGPTAPTGTVTFVDITTGTTFGTSAALSGGQASASTSFTTTGNHNIVVTYNGDINFNSNGASVTQTVVASATTTTPTSSPNPSTPGQAVTFTATVTPAGGATGTPTGIVTFNDGGTAIGTGKVGAGGMATFMTSTLSSGSHTITAVYSGDTNFGGSTSAPLIQQVGAPADSVKLRELQISATPIIAQGWGQAVSAAMDDAVTAGFGGNPQSLSPAGTGFTYYFNDDPPARSQVSSDQDSLRRYLASPNGNSSAPDAKSLDAKSAAANDSTKRVDDDFRALGYAGGMPTKAPPPAAGASRDWLAWINVRGTDYFRGTFGNDLKGDQVDAFAGLTRRISPNFVVGAFGGYEHFDYSSQAFNGVLKGDGWTAGAYLGWSSRRTCASMPAARGRTYLPMASLERPAAISPARAGWSTAV
jgi:hypothetical protein